MYDILVSSDIPHGAWMRTLESQANAIHIWKGNIYLYCHQQQIIRSKSYTSKITRKRCHIVTDAKKTNSSTSNAQ